MMRSVLSARHFHDSAAAYEFVEAHVWPDGRVCPHCGAVDRSGRLAGRSTRTGVYKCYACRKPFTVKVGTVFESSHVELHLWLQALFLVCASGSGATAGQLHRVLGVTLKTASFMIRRIANALTADESGPLDDADLVDAGRETAPRDVWQVHPDRDDLEPVLEMRHPPCARRVGLRRARLR